MARIVFDLDGTLIDSAPNMAAAGSVLIAELGRPPVTVATLKGFVGHGMRALVDRLLAHTGGIPAGGVEPHLARYRAIYGADPVTGLDALKPDPRMLWHAADQIEPGPAVLVGDSAADAAAALAAGVPFLLHAAGYGCGAIPARAVFRDFADLPAMVAGLPELRVPA